jgi:hypothetical protein
LSQTWDVRDDRFAISIVGSQALVELSLSAFWYGALIFHIAAAIE